MNTIRSYKISMPILEFLTAVVQIGNSDDKLTQAEWNSFHDATNFIIENISNSIHFSGASYPTEKWQNAAWVFDVTQQRITELEDLLSIVCHKFKQDSVAVLYGKTIFIKPTRLGH